MPKKFDSDKDIPDLTGKVILVTGGNSGIGEATVRALAAHRPKCIYLTARKTNTGDQIVKSVHEKHPEAKIEVLELDLNSFDSVEKCAAQFNRRSDRLDILFLNAGIGAAVPGLTKEGYESRFGVNYMGHALFTQLLMPKMLHAVHDSPKDSVRIILSSSIGALNSRGKNGLALDRMKTDGREFGQLNCYGHSKLAASLFAKKLANVYPSIVSTSHHPGTVKSTIWGKTEGAWWIALAGPIVWLTGVTIDEGAKTGLWSATAATGKGGVENGKFYFPIGVDKDNDKFMNSGKLQDELWQWTNEELAKHGGPGWPEA